MKKIISKYFIFFISVSILIISYALVVTASSQAVELIFANPGEDSSTQMNFSWHGTEKTSTFYYTLENNTNFSNAKTIEVNGELDSTTYESQSISNYIFELSLDNLTVNTTYLYKVKVLTSYSSINKFQTAGKAGNFNFIWMSDPHVYNSSYSDRYTGIKTMYNYVTNTQGVNIPLVVSTGDDVAYGGSYVAWQTLNTQAGFFNSAVFASTPGNHTYYDNGASTLISNNFFETMMNNPDNKDEGESSYWFIYNSILFISLDSISSSTDSTVMAHQKTLFANAITENEGKYQYIIVLQHYPWMNALTGAKSGPYGSNYNKWHELFDEYNVDIALSGDYHCYYRSKHIDSDQYIDDENSEVGTVYIGSPQIGGRQYYISDHIDEDYFAKRVDSSELAGCSGLTYFSVTNEGITGTLIDLKGTVQDTYTIKAKRDVSWENTKDKISSSFIFSSNDSTNMIDYNKTYTEYLDNIKVYNGQTLLTEAKDIDNTYSSINISNLNRNSNYSLKVVLTFIDNTTKEFNLSCSTFSNYGEIYGLKAEVTSNLINISWQANLKNNIIKKYKLYLDDKLVIELDTTSSSCSIDKSKTNLNSKYYLECLNENNVIVCTYTAYYSIYGDANYDGTIDKSDSIAIMNGIADNTLSDNNTIRLLDQNNDNKIDILDASIIYYYTKNKISSLNTEYFTVTVLDKDSNVISIQNIEYGKDAIIPELNDTNFSHWSNSFNYISCDLVIKAINK